jgi:hypothetical protein
MLMPMRKSMRRSDGNGALLLAIAACTSAAHLSASMTLANSTSNPSPVVLTDDAALMAGDLRIDQLDAERPEPAERVFLVGLDQPRIAGHIAGKDRREPTFDASVRCALHGASSVAPCSE